MPTPSPAKGGKLPKAKVVYSHNYGNTRPTTEIFHISKKWGKHVPVAILPTATKVRAARICKAHNMTHEQRAEFVAAQLFHPLADYDRVKYPDQIRREQSEAILFALGLGVEATR